MTLDGFSIDASDLDDLARKLRHAATSARAEVDKSLYVAGVEMAEAAKGIASSHGSTTIPASIKVEPLPGAVRLTADAPLAVPWEMGNKGGKRTSSTFRHPVFATGSRDEWTWVEQPRYRYFAPARARLRRQTINTLTGAWTRALRHSGLKTEG